MNNSIQHPATFTKGLLLFSLLLIGSFANAQTAMYGDTVFWENFGTGTTRTDITGLGKIGGLYKYEGPINYVYALNPQMLEDYKTANPALPYVTSDVTWHDAPILTSSPQYAIKPTSTTPTWTNQYYKITSWRNRTFSTIISANTQTLPAWDDTYLTTAAGYETQIPAAWVLVNGDWKFGFYYITYTNNLRTPAPDDGHYAIISDLDNLNGDYLKQQWHDHTGVATADISTSPYDPYITYTPLLTKTPTTVTPKPRASSDGRMLFVNCAAVAGITGPVYKRLVPELCRDAEFEFSAWTACVHYSTNNSQFRIEFWSEDPGNDPGLGSLDNSYEGLNIPEANNARLIKVGTTTALGTPADLGKWTQIKENFKLTLQDYVWVVVRNYGQGGVGNDIVIDDLVFKPYAPFNLSVVLSAASVASACVDGLVTLLSYFPPADSIPGYIDITQYGFYFEGQKSDGFWYRLGNSIPLQTQSSTIPLELTLPLAEYNLYDRFRVTAATTPAGFGGKCVTFTLLTTPKQPIPSTPQFRISGKDICDDTTSSQQGTFIIKNTNQTSCNGWHIKVRMPNGDLQTFIPAVKATCP